MRKTLNRVTVVDTANRMIEHLSESGTKEDMDKRNAIIAFTSTILLGNNSYQGFRYLNDPVSRIANDQKKNWLPGFIPPHITVNGAGDWVEKIYDDSRIKFL